MGFPFVCYKYILLPLVNKDAALAYSRADYNQDERDIEREKVESKRYHVAAKGGRHHVAAQEAGGDKL